MKRAVIALLTSTLIFASNSFAAVSSMKIKFGGGCFASNTTSGCTIKGLAVGSKLSSEKVLIQHSADRNGRYTDISKNPRSLTESGQVTFKFRNEPGCYRVINAPNGNDVPDFHSNTICEK